MSVNELTPMGPLTLVKDTFIAVDVEDPETPPENPRIVRFVGTVVGLDEAKPLEMSVLRLQDPDDENLVREIVVGDITEAFWAPMGYRP